MWSDTLKFLITFFGAMACVCLYSCANQTTPAGGPKDEDPPKLLSSSPRHKQKNFDKKEITLEFDEYVALNNAKEEILISPSPGKNITYTAKKTKVIIEPEDGWEDSTTYSVSFREGIRDITENNAPENLKLAFSTGPTIDSLEIRGRVKFAISEDLPEKITIAIYKSDTFDIFEHTPSYFSMSTKSGAFSIENIKEGKYFIYAFGDNNKNLKVESRSESFGFLSNPIKLFGEIDSLTIPLVRLDTRLLKINNIRNNGLTTTIKFNKYITQYSLEYEDPELVIHSYGADQTEVVMYNPDHIMDSLKFHISGTDSLLTSRDSTFYIKATDNKFLKDNFTVSSTRPIFDLEKSTYNLKLNLSKPLFSFTTDSMFIRLDSLTIVPISSDVLLYDTIKKQISASIPVIPDSLFKNKRKPELVFSPSSFISFELDSSKTIIHSLGQVKQEDTGILLIDVETNEKNFIIQLLTGDNEIQATATNQKKVSFKNLPAQSYKLRAIIDSNNNGIWDVGNIYLRQEPERTYYYQAPDKKFTFPIRANWELGPLLLKF